MKALLLLTLGGLAIMPVKSSSFSCQCANERTAKGQITRVEQVVDRELKSPRLRWIVALKSHYLAGLGGQRYTHAKVFNLSDSVLYHPGVSIRFHYTLVPYAHQTPWRTRYEWLAVPAAPAGAVALPEITLSHIQQLRD